jgi:hypothetical protein
VKSEVHDEGGDAAVCEIVAGIAALRGPPGLEALVVDLAEALANVIERMTTAEGLAVEDVANVLFFDEGSGPGTASGVAAIRLRERYSLKRVSPTRSCRSSGQGIRDSGLTDPPPTPRFG